MIFKMFQELKSSTLKMNGKMEHIIKEIEDIKKNQMENIELSNIITKIRNSLDRDDKESLKLRPHQ